MPLSFPSNPSVNQTVTTGGRVFRWSGSAWEFATVGASGNLAVTVTIPGLGDPYWANVSLLLNMDGSNNSTTFTDSSNSPVTITPYGNAKISTSQSKFGGASAAFDGAGDYLSVPTGAHTNFGTGDFVIEGWVRLSSLPATQCFIGMQDNATSSSPICRILITSSGVVLFTYRGVGVSATDMTSTGTVSANQWNHIAVSRSSNVFRLYLNGVLEATSNPGTAITLDISYPFFIGSGNVSGSPVWDLSGNIDDVRITKGSARGYTGATIPVPTAAFSGDLTLPVSFTGGTSPVLADPSALKWSSVPASATATGTAGQVAYDGSYFYVCTATSTWIRYAGSTWAPFSPASVTGLQLWLDASDASSLYDATSGGSLVAADGAVARWEDKSGNGRHATQSTSGSRPLRKASQQNSKDTLYFNESAFLSVPSSTATFKFLHNADSSIFFVTRPGVTSDPQKILTLLSTSTGGSGGQPAFSIFYEDRVLPSDNYTANDACNVLIGRASAGDLSTGATVVDVGGTTTPVGLTNWTANQYSLISCVIRPTNGTAANRLSQRKNGGTAITGNTGTATPGTGDAPQNLTIGSLGGSASLLWLGNIAEICIYNAALSDTDRAAVESYLMTKWGIS